MAKFFLSFLSLFLFSSTVWAQYDDFDDDYSPVEQKFGIRLSAGISQLAGMGKRTSRGTIPGTNIEVDNFKASSKFACSMNIVMERINHETKNFSSYGADFSIMGAGLKDTYAYDYNDMVKMTSINLFYLRLNSYFGKVIFNKNNPGMNFVIGVGPFLSIEPSFLPDEWGSEEYDSTPNDPYENGMLFSENISLRYFDVGLSVMAGMNINDFQISASCSRGFINVIKDEKSSGQNMMFSLGLAYFFNP